jgi:branched-chain amino acid transport system ATP-binding protein
MLTVDELTGGYGRIEVLHGVSFDVRAGAIVCLVGSNGAGKTTLLRTISGVVPMTHGSIRFEGEPIERLPPHVRVALGIVQVPEGRQLFAPLSVEDNLDLGAWPRRSVDFTPERSRVYDLFPILAERRHISAGALSGGQQQMLAIGRALMAKPRLLLLDEPSLGLAPLLVEQILRTIVELKRDGITVLLIEQNARAALAIADDAYVLETGRITARGTAAEIERDERIRTAYLGV